MCSPRTCSILALATWALGCPALTCLAADEPVKPNVVFILADDLGYADVGCYGQRRIKTPNIDRLAREGMRFTQHYCGCAVCAPSRCVLMTGLHTGHAFIRDNKNSPQPDVPQAVKGQVPIPNETFTLAEAFQEQGYATAALGKWGLGGHESTGDPLRQGIDRFFGYLDQGHAHNFFPSFIWDNGQRLPLRNLDFAAHQKFPADSDPNDPASYRRYAGQDYVPDLVTEQALRFIRENRQRPFLLYLPTTVPHLGLQVPENSLAEYRGQWPDPPYLGQKGYVPQFSPRAAYAAMITRMDRDIGQIIDLVRELGLDDRTLFVFTSDNGPTYDLSGGADTDFFESAGPLRGKKGSLYEGGIRVPCIVRGNGQIAAGTTSDRVTGFEDWMPTLLELIGATEATPAGLDGISFAPTLRGQAQPPREFLYREFPNYGGQQSVRIGDWKGVRQNLIPPGKDSQPDLRIELYDLARDIGESQNVADQHPDVVARMARLMREQHTPSAEFPLPALDDLVREP